MLKVTLTFDENQIDPATVGFQLPLPEKDVQPYVESQDLEFKVQKRRN